MFDALEEKYGAHSIQTPPAPDRCSRPGTHKDNKPTPSERSSRPATYKDSKPIMTLSDYIKSVRDKGFSFVLQDNRPCIHLDPPLHPKDEARSEILNHALDLIELALPDIEYFLSKGALPMQQHPGYL